MKNKKGIVPIIAIILLLMMAIAAAAVTFYWLTKIQGQIQGGTEQYEEKSFERMASTVRIASAGYNLTSEILDVYLENVGTITIPISNKSTDPTTMMRLADADGNIICIEKICATCMNTTVNITPCKSGCGGNLEPNMIQKVRLNLDNTTCNLTDQSNETAINLDLYLSGKATASTTFRIRTSSA